MWMEGQNSPVVFSEWLKRRRKALDLTQDELAKRADCSVGALRKIESGERKPSKQLAALIAKALELSNEDQKIFIRVARGELNLERLPQSYLERFTPLPDVSILQQAQPRTSLRPGSCPASNRIPVQATPLIGREAELAALERIFNDGQCRLLTLTGIGGIGKTRLAIHFAARSLSAFPGGVFYIPLTPVDAPEKIVPAIAESFDFRFSGPGEPQEQLFNYLSSRIKQKALFILDNLEHLLAQVPTRAGSSGLVELVAELLQRLPHVSILGTSRERLNLHGEWTYELHGLSVPPTSFAGPAEEYNSVALFIKSAQRIRADFGVTLDEQPYLVQICQLVSGVPLAIELAAAWAGMLSCQEIAQEIQSNMDFLTTRMRDIPERHRSIRATFDHSWKLLSDEERGALCQLSVFHGGFDRCAAQQVAGASLALLSSLSAKSLVRRAENGRFDLHEVIRQYALSHLMAHPRNHDTYERHSEYYLAFTRDREKDLKSAAQQEGMRQMTSEIDNIRAAWAWAVQHKKYAQLGDAGRAFGWYFEIAGLYREGIGQLEALVQSLKAEPQNDRWQRLLGLALVHQALLYFRQGDFGSAIQLYGESIAILRPVGDPVLLADALIYSAIILHSNGEFAPAMSCLEEGLVLARAGNERWLEALAVANLGYTASLTGRCSEGYEQMMAGLALFRTIGDPHVIAMILNFLVPVLIKLGRYEEARACMQESISLCEQSKNRWGMGTAYGFLGLACIAEGEYAAAKAHLLKSLEIFKEYITGWNIARSLTYLGDAARLAGETAEAREFYLKGLRSSVEAKALPIALEALLGLGYLQDQAGKAEPAMVLCDFILNHPSSEEETKIRAGQLRASLENQLDCERIEAARAASAEKSLDEIIKYGYSLF